MRFDNQVVMITGAAGSLGKAVAAGFAAGGARLALADVSEAVLQQAYPGTADTRLLLPANLLDSASAQNAVNAAMQKFGRLDALCNIAGGFAMGTPVHATAAADWQKMQDINVGTLLNAVRAAVPAMLAGGGGKIVNVGAGAGQKGVAQMGAYSASKSAVIRITEAMAGELREQNINVNCVLPSIIDTPPNRAAMPDADPKKWVAPGDLAAVITFLCSEQARAVRVAVLGQLGPEQRLPGLIRAQVAQLAALPGRQPVVAVEQVLVEHVGDLRRQGQAAALVSALQITFEALGAGQVGRLAQPVVEAPGHRLRVERRLLRQGAEHLARQGPDEAGRQLHLQVHGDALLARQLQGQPAADALARNHHPRRRQHVRLRLGEQAAGEGAEGFQVGGVVQAEHGRASGQWPLG